MVGVSKRAEKDLNKEVVSDPVDMRSRLRPTIVDMKKTRLSGPSKAFGRGVTRSTQAQVPLKVVHSVKWKLCSLVTRVKKLPCSLVTRGKHLQNTKRNPIIATNPIIAMSLAALVDMCCPTFASTGDEGNGAP